MIRPDVSGAFGTVITVGAGVVALRMVSSLGENVRQVKNKPQLPTFARKSYVPKQIGLKPIRWKL